MRKSRALFAALGMPAVVAAGLAIAPVAANAAYVCGAGQVCLYENINLTGTVRVVSGNIPDFQFTNYSNGTNMNDSVSSIVNNSGKTLQGWPDHNYQGLIRMVVGPGGKVLDMTQDAPLFFGGTFEGGGNFNDVMSSVQLG